MSRFRLIMLSFALGGVVVATVATTTHAQDPAAETTANVYSAKFLCGEFGKFLDPNQPESYEGPVKPGNYQTAINVRNPNGQRVSFTKFAVLVFRADAPDAEFEVPKRPGEPVEASLDADWGLEIDCRDIRGKLLAAGALAPGAPPAPTFIKGWVVIRTLDVLDVVAAYTGHTYNLDASHTLPRVTREGFAEDIERIEPQQFPVRTCPTVVGDIRRIVPCK